MTILTLRDVWTDLERRASQPFLAGATSMRRSELAAIVHRFCAAFDASGVGAGERLMIVLEDEPAAIAAFVAALLDGVVPVMLAPETPPARAAAVAASVGAAGAVVGRERLGEAWLSQFRAPIAFDAAATRKASWFARPNAAHRIADACGLPERGRPPRLPPDPDGLAYLLFTSGTTSSPTGVMIARGNLFANIRTIARVLGVDASSRLFNDMLLAHADGLVQGPLMALATGAALIRAGGFSVPGMEDWLNVVRREGATHFTSVPTVWTLIDRYARHDDYFAAPEVSILSSVAAALDPALWARLETRFGRRLVNQYGLTETVASALYAGPHPEAGAFGTVGRPVDCEARIEALEGGNGAGELQLRGANVFQGYWRNAERTKATFTADGWMKTGDLARLREDGSFEILGRLKTVIMPGGFLIRPEEIDEVLRQHPSVVDAVTVAMPDETFGEVPVSAVVLDGAADERELTALARSRLEPLKVPKRILAVDAIPRGPSGKPHLDVLTKQLREALTGLDRERRAASTPLDHERAVLETAAGVFRVDPASLSMRSTALDVEGWDSFTQLSLLFALEARFGVRIRSSRAAAIRSLSDALTAVLSARR